MFTHELQTHIHGHHKPVVCRIAICWAFCANSLQLLALSRTTFALDAGVRMSALEVGGTTTPAAHQSAPEGRAKRERWRGERARLAEPLDAMVRSDRHLSVQYPMNITFRSAHASESRPTSGRTRSNLAQVCPISGLNRPIWPGIDQTWGDLDQHRPELGRVSTKFGPSSDTGSEFGQHRVWHHLDATESIHFGQGMVGIGRIAVEFGNV